MLAAADLLTDTRPVTECTLARRAFFTHFLADPSVTDPRRARLAPHAMMSMAGDSDGFAKSLRGTACVVAANEAAAKRISDRAWAVLRSAAGQAAA